MTYSYRYRNAFQAAPAIDLLLLDAGNPRAAAFQIQAIVRHAADLPMITEVQQRGRVRALAENVQARISHVDAYELAELNATRERHALTALLHDVERTMKRIAEALGDAYLQHLRRFRA
jgi:uncharacterized alpha-E superfamily protein